MIIKSLNANKAHDWDDIPYSHDTIMCEVKSLTIKVAF